MSSLKIPSPCPNPNADCQNIYQAFQGLGCDEARLIQILSHRDYAHRRAICKAYQDTYGEDMINRMKKELHLHLEKAMVCWMHDDINRDALILNDCFGLFGVDYEGLVEILCSRSSSQTAEIKRAYYTLHGISFEEGIRSKTSGSLKELLLGYIRESRPDNDEIDLQQAREDAKSLYKAGEFRAGTDEASIIKILTARSAAHLKVTFDIYKEEYGRDISEVWKKPDRKFLAFRLESSGSFQQTLGVIASRIKDPVKYFTEALYKSMKGLGTNDSALIRVIVRRSEIDMQMIKEEFVRKYKKSLERMISDDTLGNYRVFLLSLIGSNKYSNV